MRKHILGTLLVALPLLILAGCQSTIVPVDPAEDSLAWDTGLLTITLPDGASLDSAMLNVFNVGPSSQTVYVHKITADWEELTVTWNNFGGSYDPAVVNTFSADGGWLSVDVTSAITDWLNGTSENFGLLMKQADMTPPRAKYHSRENSVDQPYLQVCYTTVDGTTCETDLPITDTFIWENTPDSNYGDLTLFYTGQTIEVPLQKQTLIRFDVQGSPPPPPQDGCTGTIGYWRNRADEIAPLLPIWLGDSGGVESLFVDTTEMAADVIKRRTYGSNRNGITKLYAQLLAAKLAIATGASDIDIAAVIVAADAFLATTGYSAWDSLSSADQSMVNGWHTMLEDYNSGDIGPGHCD